MDSSTSLSAGLPTRLGSKHHQKGSSENKHQDATLPCTVLSSFELLDEKENNSFTAGLKLVEAQKLFKYASANLTREGISAAIDDLHKALRLLHSVRNSPSLDCIYDVWKPERCVVNKNNGTVGTEEAKSKELKKSVLCILNKVASANFDTLLEKIRVLCLNIDTEERLACVAEMFCGKAIKEPLFSSVYVKMCQHLTAIEVASSTDSNETTNFRKLFLKKCQREFTNIVAELVDIEKKKKEIEFINDESKKKMLEDEFGALTTKSKKKSLEFMRLIGALFELGIISTKVIHLCVAKLLDHPDNEVALECLCRLLTTVGKDLVQPSKDGNATTASSVSVARQDRSKESGMNPSGKKVYDRNFLLDLHNCPASMMKPEGLPNLEIVRDPRSARVKWIVIGGHFPSPCSKMQPMIREGSMLTASESSPKTTDSYFSLLGTVVNNRTISNRVRFMIQEVIDLRKNNWNPCRRNNNQKTFELFHQKTDKREDQEERENINPHYLQGSKGSTSDHDIRLIQGDRRGGDRSDRNRIESRPNDDKGNMVKNTILAKQPKAQTSDSDVGISLDFGRREMRALGLRGSDGMSQSTVGDFDSSVHSQTLLVPGIRSLRPLYETNRHVFKDIHASTVTEDQIARKAHSVQEEFFTNASLENVILDLKEWLHPSKISTFINECVKNVLKRNRKERRGTGTLLKEMVKRKLITTQQVLKGFEAVLQAAEDVLVYIPKLWDYLAQLVEPIFEEGVVNIAFLGDLAAMLSPTMAPFFVAATLKELVNAQGGVAGAKRLWVMSNTSFSSILPGVDINAFVDQHRELAFVQVDSQTKRNNVVTKRRKPVATIPCSLVYLEFQRNLQHFLKMRKRSAKEVYDWIQNQPVEIGNPSFIRAVATAVIERCIDGTGTESKVNTALLKDYSEVLRNYVQHVAERELQLLFAVETLVTLRQQPKGLIQGIFESLYDGGVVSEGGIHSWMNHKAPAEQKGKAVTLR